MELYQVDYLSRHGDWRQRWEPVPAPVPLHRVIRSALLNALAYTAGDQTKAATLLEITTRTMGYQMTSHAIPGAVYGDKRARRHLPKTRRTTQES